MPYWTSIIPFLAHASNLTRDEIWAGEAVYRPLVRKHFADFPRLGHFGNGYAPGGWVFVGANGNSTEGQNLSRVEARYADQDREHIQHIEAFRQKPDQRTFAKLNAFEKRDILGWHMDWVIDGSLERLNLGIDDVVICNVIPFSTMDAPPASSIAWRNAVNLYFARLMQLLAPHGVVWMGKAAWQRSRPHLQSRPAPIEAIVSRQRNLSRTQQFEHLTLTMEQGN